MFIKNKITIIFLFFVLFIPALSNAETMSEKQSRLNSELAQILEEQKAIQDSLESVQHESASIQRDVSILTAQINQAKLNIKARNIKIEQLSKDIDIHSETIGTLSDRIKKNQQSLSELIKKTDELDSFSIAEILLSNQNMSDFLVDVDSFTSINKSLNELLNQIQTDKKQNEIEKDNLDKKRNAEIDARAEIEASKRIIEKKEAEKNKLLAASKLKEIGYAKILLDREKKASQIRAALFQLSGSAGIPFGTALDYANYASQKTGVRPAFLLAILTQESNLGKNIGTCNRPGDPVSKSWRNVMKPTRDIQPFIQITSALGLDPDQMPVSCPWQGGYGGAMGPSQFIPSTWLLYKDKIAKALGIGGMPNPWEPKDAFMASAIYLGELGASNGGYTAERTAALKYYAGAAWAKSKNAFYGNQVMAKAQDIQENMIDMLNNI
ncbi:lytic murein transglycosylase [Candidatus Nomurabacteria bacterium]|nr:lytic murein transglycosylase [Candidatus Nomurabacteria bacterium]